MSTLLEHVSELFHLHICYLFPLILTISNSRRKRGSYKHTYTDSYFTDAINLEASEKESPIPSEQSLDRTTAAHVTTADREVDGE